MRQPRKIAILGTASTSLRYYPEDPESGWELWGMVKAEVHRELRRGRGCAAYFEPHDRALWGHKTDVFAKVKAMIWMQEAHEEIPSSRKYPLDRVLDTLPDSLYGRGEQTPNGSHRSTIAYMIALAIVELGPQHNKSKGQRDEIGLWGVEMTAEGEYGYQKPNCEALLGFAMGWGINVLLPGSTTLLKGNTAYGYQPRAATQGPVSYEHLFRRRNQLNEVLVRAARSTAEAEGIIRFIDAIGEKLDGNGIDFSQDWWMAQRMDYLSQGVDLSKTVSNLEGQLHTVSELLHLIDHHDRGGAMGGVESDSAVDGKAAVELNLT